VGAAAVLVYVFAVLPLSSSSSPDFASCFAVATAFHALVLLSAATTAIFTFADVRGRFELLVHPSTIAANPAPTGLLVGALVVVGVATVVSAAANPAFIAASDVCVPNNGDACVRVTHVRFGLGTSCSVCRHCRCAGDFLEGTVVCLQTPPFLSFSTGSILSHFFFSSSPKIHPADATLSVVGSHFCIWTAFAAAWLLAYFSVTSDTLSESLQVPTSLLTSRPTSQQTSLQTSLSPSIFL
jgi:hypothetical protein